MSDDNSDEFQWDYSYFNWQDIPREVRSQMVRAASQFGRTWMHGRTWVVADIFKCDARKMYNKNWDGCRDPLEGESPPAPAAIEAEITGLR
jgi:hypothetical protein